MITSRKKNGCVSYAYNTTRTIASRYRDDRAGEFRAAPSRSSPEGRLRSAVMFVADAIPAGSPSGARCRSCLRARRRYRTTGVPPTTNARAGTPTPTVLPTRRHLPRRQVGGILRRAHVLEVADGVAAHEILRGVLAGDAVVALPRDELHRREQKSEHDAVHGRGGRAPAQGLCRATLERRG